MTPYGDIIRALRKQKGLTQQELAEKVSVTRSAISQFEKGESKASVQTLIKIAEALGVTLGSLTGEDTAPFDAHAVGRLIDMPSVELPHASFRTWASFLELAGSDVGSGKSLDGELPTLLFRLPPGRTAEDYKDAIVFDIEGDSMEPNLYSGQQVIAWQVPESKWEYLHNTACIVSYDDTVTVKAIVENELFASNRLTLRATGGLRGSFAVPRSSIHSIWEVREFYSRVEFRLIAP
jgi:transcriptional regulator with XRE-family HTH domain